MRCDNSLSFVLRDDERESPPISVVLSELATEITELASESEVVSTTILRDEALVIEVTGFVSGFDLMRRGFLVKEVVHHLSPDGSTTVVTIEL